MKMQDLLFQEFLKTFSGREFILRNIRDEIFKGEAISNSFLELFNKLLEEGKVIRTNKTMSNLPVYKLILEITEEEGKISNKDVIGFIKRYLTKKGCIQDFSIEEKENKVIVVNKDKSTVINLSDNEKNIRRKLRKIMAG